jgi:16S rRNA C967 or C1407 C5-methylase (RsmB/RsmF family)
LVDAPCSSERHVLLNEAELAKWNLKRPLKIQTEQISLVNSAARQVKVGGILVYSTCAVTSVENDSVMEAFEKLHPQWTRVENLENAQFKGLERTCYGFQILPDQSEGAGPIYFSKWVRNG